MSIEKILTGLTEALNEHTAALNAFIEAGGSAPAASGSTKAASGTKASGSTKASAGSKTTKTKGATTAEDVAAKVTAYLKEGTKAEREERKAQVKQIIDHYGADRFTTIDPENFDEALGMLAQFENGEDPFGGDGAGEDDEDGAMV